MAKKGWKKGPDGKYYDPNAQPKAEVLFTAGLELRNIDKSGAHYRVTVPSGLKVDGLSHIQIARSEFPKDDDFNMDFMNANLDAIKPVNADDTVDKKAVKKLKDKQTQFRKFRYLTLTIQEKA